MPSVPAPWPPCKPSSKPAPTSTNETPPGTELPWDGPNTTCPRERTPTRRDAMARSRSTFVDAEMDHKFLQKLAKALRSWRPKTRRNAAEHLAAIAADLKDSDLDTTAVVQRLGEALRDTDDEVRRAASE